MINKFISAISSNSGRRHTHLGYSKCINSINEPYESFGRINEYPQKVQHKTPKHAISSDESDIFKSMYCNLYCTFMTSSIDILWQILIMRSILLHNKFEDYTKQCMQFILYEAADNCWNHRDIWCAYRKTKGDKSFRGADAWNLPNVC